MNAIGRRLRRLEANLTPKKNEQRQSLAEVLRERRCRIAKERGVPYEQVLRESLIKHETFMANYHSNGTIADILRYGRRRELETPQGAS